jgi:hypothetical protein
MLGLLLDDLANDSTERRIWAQLLNQLASVLRDSKRNELTLVFARSPLL